MRFVPGRIPALLLALTAVVSAGLSARALAGPDIMPLGEVKPGMKGTCRTVFQRTEIQSFSFEVVDILRNHLPGQDVILARCTGEGVSRTGIASGMSGSPCTIDGKLIGALAYAWPWSSEALAGITPIETMLDIANRPLEKKVERPARGGLGGLEPIETPLFVSARCPRALAFLEKACGPHHLRPVGSGQGSGAFHDLDAPLEPGAAVGVLLMEGDMEAYAVGTVTWAEGNKVLAFGHSFLQEGESVLPLTNAWTYTVVSRMPGSFKMSATGKVLGALVQDRQAGILGLLDVKAPLVPMTIVVRNPRVESEKTFNLRLARHPSFTPMIAGFALMDALGSAEPGPGEVSQEVVLTFTLAGHDDVSVRMYFSRDEGFWGRDFLAPVGLVLGNEFEKTELESIRVEADVVHEGRTARISGLRLERTEYAPGDTVDIHVEITPFRKPPFWTRVSHVLPKILEPGPYRIEVAPTDEAPMTEEAPAPEDVATLLQAIRALNERRADTLVAVLQRPGVILQHKGRRYFDLPLSALYGLLAPNESGGFRVARRYWKSKPVNVGYFVAGGRTASITVKE